ARAVVLEALANLLLSLALVGPLGIEGVALGTTLPHLLGNLAVLWHVARLLGVPLRDCLRQSFLAPCLAAMGLAGWWLVLPAWWPVTTWPELLGIGLAGVLPFGALAWLVEFGPGWRAARARPSLLREQVA